MYMMRKMFLTVSAALLASCAMCQDNMSSIEPQQMIVTNLTDKLHTRVSIDPSLGMDIRRLNLDSIHADKHKSRMTLLTDMTVSLPNIKTILSVKPVIVKDSIGQMMTVTNAYVVNAQHKSTRSYEILDASKINGIAVTDLAISDFYINSKIIDNVPSISHINLIEQIDSTSISNRFFVNSLVDSNIAAFNALSPSIIAIDNASAKCPVAVIDNSRFHIEVNDGVYAELAEMKLIYNFEQNYNESIKTRAKLSDIHHLDRDMYLKWINILSSNKVCSIRFIKNRKIRKIISEAWILNKQYSQSNRQNLLKNLDFFKSKEYSTVLVRFDCTEDKTQLANMIDDICQAGFTVFATYVGQDNLCPCWNPYIDPEVLEDYISLIAPKCEGFFLNWRTMSNHAKVLPIEFFNYMCTTLRKYNDQILLYGEIYYGRIDPLNITTLLYTMPSNVTGVVVNNMGYYGYNTKYIVNNLFATAVPGYRKLDKIFQVIGYGPYYCSHPDSNANLPIDKEYKYKEEVENSFKRTGYGTATLCHDGVDDGMTYLIAKPNAKYSYNTTDNIVYDIKIWKSLEQPSLDNGSNSL